MDESQKLLKLFPTAICSICKVYADVKHYLVLDQRPEVLKVNVKEIVGEIYIVLPAKFSFRYLERSVYCSTIFEIVFSNEIVFDFLNKVQNFRFYLLLGLTQSRTENCLSIKKALCQLKEYSNYLNLIKRDSSKLSDIKTLYNLLTIFYSVTNDSLFEKQVPSAILNAINSWIKKNNGSELCEVLRKVINANLHVNSREFFFYYIDARNDNDFGDIVFCFLNFLREEMEYLKSNNEMLLCLNGERDSLLIKVKDVKETNPQLYTTLGRINNVLQVKLGKNVLKFNKEDLNQLQEEFSISSIVFRAIERDVFEICLNILQANETEWSEKLAMKAFFDTTKVFIDRLKVDNARQFITYLMFSFNLDSYRHLQQHSFFNFEKGLNKMKIQLESNMIIDFIETDSSFNYNSILDIKVKKAADKFFSKIKELTETDLFELIVSSKSDYYYSEIQISNSDLFLFKQLKDCFELIARLLGIRENDQIYMGLALSKTVEWA